MLFLHIHYMKKSKKFLVLLIFFLKGTSVKHILKDKKFQNLIKFREQNNSQPNNSNNIFKHNTLPPLIRNILICPIAN